MNSTLLKSTVRSILHNKLRFLSVILVVCLGTSFYVGIKSSSPQIQDSANIYFSNYNLPDIIVTSPVAFTDDDLVKIAELGGIEKITKSKYTDVLVNVDGNSVIGRNGTELTCRIRSLNVEKAAAFTEKGENDSFYFNRIELIEGRYPQNSGECLIDTRLAEENNDISIGSELTLFGDGSGVTDSLVTDRFKIVGTAATPLYISDDCGTTQVGSGLLDTFAYVSESDFKTDECNEVFIKISRKGYSSSFSSGYSTVVSRISNKIKSISGGIINQRLLTLKNDYRDKISSKEAEIDAFEKQSSATAAEKQKTINKLNSLIDTKNEAVSQLKSDIESEKVSAKTALDSARAAYNSLKTSYESNQKEYSKSGSEINGYTEMKKLYDDLNAKHTTDEEKLSGLKSGVNNAKEGLDKANDELTGASGAVNSCENKIKTLKNDIADLNTEISGLDGTVKEDNSAVAGFQKQISTLQSEVKALNAKLEDGTITGSERLKLASDTAQLTTLNQNLSDAENKLEKDNSQLKAKKSSLTDKKSQLTSQESLLPSLKDERTSAESRLSLAQSAYDSANSSYSAFKSSYDEDSATLEKYKNSLDKLTAGKAKIVQLAETVENQKSELQTRAAAVTQAQIRYTLASRTSESRLSKAAYEFVSAGNQAAELKKELDSYNTFTEQKRNDLNADLTSLNNMLRNINDVTWNVTPQTDMLGHKSLISSIESINSMANVLPVIFLFAAMLTCFVLMLKNVEEDRNEFGLLKALGYGNISVTLKYVFYAFLAWAFGCFIGTAFGVCFFPRVIYSIYGGDYSIPDIGFAFNIRYILKGMAVSLVTTLLACGTALLRELFRQPAALMHGREINYSKRSLVERIPGIWAKFNYGLIILTRAISRNRHRVVIGTLSIACCTALVFSSFAMLGATAKTKNAQYGANGIFRYDIQIVLNSSQLPETSKTLSDLKESEKSESALLVSKSSYNITTVPELWTKIDNAQVVVPSDTAETEKYIDLQVKSGTADFNNGAIVSEKLADNLGFQPGDTIYLSDYKNETFPVTVTAVVRNYIDNYIYMSPQLYKQVFSEEPVYKYILCQVKSYIKGPELDTFIKSLLDSDEIIGAVSRISLAETAEHSLAQSLSLSILFIVSACVLAAIVIYTITNINVFERTREIANIKVIGFTDAEVLVYISRENIISAIVGILLGLLSGLFLHKILIGWICVGSVIYTESVDFSCFLLTFVTIFLVIIVSAVPIVYRIKKINMPETLKKAE